jgi:hypothetical protein
MSYPHLLSIRGRLPCVVTLRSPASPFPVALPAVLVVKTESTRNAVFRGAMDGAVLPAVGANAYDVPMFHKEQSAAYIHDLLPEVPTTV